MTYIYQLDIQQPKTIPKGKKPTRVNAPAKPGPKCYPATIPCLKPQVTQADIRAIMEGKTISALRKKDGW